MARSVDKNSQKIYEIADVFREQCLKDEGSLFYSEKKLWTEEFFTKINKCFIENPDTSSNSFIEKFKEQLKGQDKEVFQLAAELLSVYFLLPTNVTRAHKLGVVNEVLGWGHNQPLANNHPIAKAFEQGLVNPGISYNVRRPFELAFLITFILEWRKCSHERQEKLLIDPWAFQEFVDKEVKVVPEFDKSKLSTSRQMRHMILHLVFPDYFESIVSNSHKNQIVRKFSGLVETDTNDQEDSDNIEKKLYAIRQKLHDLIPNKMLDFYQNPLRAAWLEDTGSESGDLTPTEALLIKKQIVLYGPPGTGKTHSAKKMVESLLRSIALKKWGAATYFQSEDKIIKAIKNNIHRLQLHPAYGYEDFVRGLHITDKGATEYRLGYLPKLIEKIEVENKMQEPQDCLPHVLILDEMNRTDLSRMLGECFSLLEDREQTIDLPGLDLQGEPLRLRIPDNLYIIGTMNLIDQSIEQIDFALRRRFLWVYCPFNADALLNITKSNWENLLEDTKTISQRYSWEKVEGDFQKLAVSAKKLNEKIKNSNLLGEQYEIGHTYFGDVVDFLYSYLDNFTSSKTNYLWDRGNKALEPVQQLWKFSLQPLLEQYLMGYDAGTRSKELEKLSEVFLTAEDLDATQS